MKVLKNYFSLIFEKSCSTKTYHRGKSYDWISKIQKALDAQINFGKSHQITSLYGSRFGSTNPKTIGGHISPPPGPNRVNNEKGIL